MRKILSVIALIAITAPTTLANPFINIPDQIPQGTTLKIEFPKNEQELVSADVDGKTINFYEIERTPKWDEKITRAEFLKLLFDNYNFDAVVGETIDFPDVDKESMYYDYIQKAQKLGIISGYADGNFGPYDPITRSHIAKILVEAFDPPEYLNQAPSFPDVNEDDWHFEYINRAVKAKYFQGYPDGFMQPNRYINFDEAEIVIKRAAVPQGFIGIDTKTYYVGYVGFHRMNDIGTKNIKIITRDKNDDYQINVTKRDYPSLSFYLEEEKNELFASDKIDNTWDLINGAKANPHPKQLWNGEFIVPTDGILTVEFGEVMYINGNYSGSHFGIDYANAEGTPIYASNNGIVTLASDTMSYGYTVIIDHGHNVFTMYLHNHTLEVEEGQHVNKGDLIATMGTTGISTGPHLHFTFFIGDVIVDNYEWYEGKF